MSFPSPGNPGQQANQPYLQAGQPYPQQPGQPPYPQPAQAYPQGQPYSLRTQPYPQQPYSQPGQPYSGGPPYGPPGQPYPQGLQPYPPMQPGSGPPQVARPKAMDAAVILMRIGAVMSLLEIVAGVFTLYAARDQINSMRDQINSIGDSAFFADSFSSMASRAIMLAVVVQIVMGLIHAGLWIWMSIVNGRGKSWARIVATVLFGLSVLLTLRNVVGSAHIAAALVYITTAAVGTIAIVLMYRPESNHYYDQMSRPQFPYMAW